MGVSVSCCSLERYRNDFSLADEDLREPLVRRQGSQVSMRVARGSASWLSSHGRGLGHLTGLLLLLLSHISYV